MIWPLGRLHAKDGGLNERTHFDVLDPLRHGRTGDGQRGGKHPTNRKIFSSTLSAKGAERTGRRTDEAPAVFSSHPFRKKRKAGPPGQMRLSQRGFTGDFNLHLLRADVVGDIFSRNGQAITAGRQLIGNANSPVLADSSGFQRKSTGKAPSSCASRCACWKRHGPSGGIVSPFLNCWRGRMILTSAACWRSRTSWTRDTQRHCGHASPAARYAYRLPCPRGRESASARCLLCPSGAAAWCRPKGKSATTETMDGSVRTRNTGSPGRITRGRRSARGTARKDV